jgi:hypothetical protein
MSAYLSFFLLNQTRAIPPANWQMYKDSPLEKKLAPPMPNPAARQIH